MYANFAENAIWFLSPIIDCLPISDTHFFYSFLLRASGLQKYSVMYPTMLQTHLHHLISPLIAARHPNAPHLPKVVAFSCRPSLFHMLQVKHYAKKHIYYYLLNKYYLLLQKESGQTQSNHLQVQKW